MGDLSPLKMAMVVPASLPPRAQVIEQLADNLSLIWPEATAVATQVPVPAGRAMDVLGVDAEGVPLIVNVCAGRDLTWPVHVLHQVSWVREHRRELARRYKNIDAELIALPRAAVILPYIAEPLRRALTFLGAAPISFFVARCYRADDARFLALEPYADSAEAGVREEFSSLLVRPSTGAPVLRQEPFVPVDLTEAEVKDFLDGGIGQLSVSSS